MRRFYILLLIITASGSMISCSYRFFESACDYPLPGNLIKQSPLDSELVETSGLLYLDGLIWSFNDSGGEPALYGFNPSNGQVIRKTIIGNVTNTDWESIAMNDSTVFIADVGNNFNTRDTLVIYMVPKQGLISGDTLLNQTGEITLTFDEKIIQNVAGYSSHDCEALLSCGDSLFLFTKDWIEHTTSVYVLPASPGHYNVKKRHQYMANILVTGADLYPPKKQVVLVGYRSYMPIVITYCFSENPGLIICGGKARIYPLKRGRQVEGICFNDEGGIFVTSERSLQRQTLFRVVQPGSLMQVD